MARAPRWVASERQIGDQRQGIRRLTRQGRRGRMRLLVYVKVAPHEEYVEGPDRECRRKRVRTWAGAPEAARAEKAVTEGPPDVVEVAAHDDRRAFVQALKGRGSEEVLEL